MDIVKLVTQVATPGMLAQAAGLLGISGETAQKGLGAAVPGVLAALLGAGQRPGGTDALGAALTRAGDADALERDPAAAASSGSDLLGSLLGGDSVGKLASALEGYAGVPKAGAGSLLGLAGSMALGALGKAAGDRGAAGVLGLLDAGKDQISAAIPQDFAKALGDTGLLAGLGGAAAAAAAPVAPKPVPPRPAAPAPAPPPPPKSGWSRWLLWLVAAAVLLWLLMRWLAPAPVPVVETAPAPEAAAPTTTAEPAAADTAATPENPLVVGGVDIGAGVQGALDQVTGALAGITDAATAQSALPELTAARDALAGMETSVGALPETGKSALQSLVAAALPGIETTANSLLGDTAVSGVVKPVVDDILARLRAFAA